MSQPRLLQNQFLGFQRDRSRDQLPPGYLYDCINMLPNLGVPLKSRGPWSYKGNLLTSINASAGYPGRVMYAPFQSVSPQVLAVDDSLHRIFDVTNNIDRGASGLTGLPLHTPVFFNDLVILTDGIAAAQKYAGASAAALGGSPPATPRCAAVYKGRLLLSGASSSASEMSKIYFSAAGNPESWDTTNRWLSTSAPVQGIAALRNAVLVFHYGSVERIRGDVPPGSSAANMTLEPLFDGIGIYDPNAFAVAEDSVIWAEISGIYQSDGASISDLTQQGGIKKYWADTFTGASVANIAVGYYSGYAFVSVLASNKSFIDFLICDTKTRGWYRLNNVQALNFSSQSDTTDAFYFSNQNTKAVGNLTGIFNPLPSTTTDANGTAITCQVGLPYYTGGSQAKKRVRWVYVTYDMEADTGSPTLLTGYATEQNHDSTYSSTTLNETSIVTRSRVPIAKASPGLSVTLTRSGNGYFDLYAIEADITPREGSRR